MTTKIVDIADEIYREMGEPADLSIASIAFWLRTNIGKLNILIHKPYLIDATNLEIYSSDEAKDPFGINEKDIFKKMYGLFYYERLLRNALGAASTDSTIEISENGFSARKINKNELAKTYSDLKKQIGKELEMLLAKYELNEVSPLQIAGDDTVQDLTRSYGYSTYIRDIENL